MTLSMTYWWAIVLLGLVAGALSGSLGVGSGIIVIPVLVLFFDCGQKSAQGMALALMVPMALLGVLQYSRTPGVQLQWEFIALLIVGALAGVMVGTRLMAQIPDVWLQRCFAVFLLIVATRMLWHTKSSQTSAVPRSPAVQVPATGEHAQHE